MQLTEADQDIYRNFNIVISERWQQEIADTIFELVNQDTDKHEMKKRTKLKAKLDEEKGITTCQYRQYPYFHRLRRHRARLYEEAGRAVHFRMADKVREIVSVQTRALSGESQQQTRGASGSVMYQVSMRPLQLVFMDQVEEVSNDLQTVKGENCIVIKLKEGTNKDTRVILTNQARRKMRTCFHCMFRMKSRCVSGTRLYARRCACHRS